MLKDITLELKDEYRGYARGMTLSGYSFSNIFMSRDCTHYKYMRVDGNGMAIVCLPPGKKPMCLFPMGAENVKRAVEEVRKELGEVDIVYLTYCMKQTLKRYYGEQIQFSSTMDNADYVYDVPALIDLQGEQYHGKRNFINRFENRYDYDYVALEADNISLIEPLVEKWFEEHPGYESPMFNEKTAISELMKNFDALDLSGAAIRVEGEIVAFTIGEQLTDDMAHIIIEKGDTRYPGVYPLINRDFLKNRWSNMKLVNREEDMGLEGLRKAKQSYHPAFMNVVYSGQFV